MDSRRKERKIDPEILRQSVGILDDILEKLGTAHVLHLARSGTDERCEKPIDAELANLSGGIFGRLPAEPIPLEAFHVDELGEAAPVSRPRTDSVAPIAYPSLPPEPERGRAWRPAPWVLPCAMAAGLAGFVATGTVVRTMRAAHPAAAHAHAATVPEPVTLAQAPAPSADPAPAPLSRPVPAPAAWPRPAPRLAAAPPAAVRTPAAAAPAMAKAPSPEPDPADLPLVLPPLPPKPQVAFDRAAAAVAIANGGLRAASCRKDGAGSAAVPVSVTFAPSGSVISVRVTGGALVGTAERGCVAAALRGAHVSAFDGEPVAVGTVVHLR